MPERDLDDERKMFERMIARLPDVVREYMRGRMLIQDRERD